MLSNLLNQLAEEKPPCRPFAWMVKKILSEALGV